MDVEFDPELMKKIAGSAQSHAGSDEDQEEKEAKKGSKSKRKAA
jgi:hypothetical protein